MSTPLLGSLLGVGWRWGLRRGTTSSGSSAMRERRSIRARERRQSRPDEWRIDEHTPVGEPRRCGLAVGVCEEGRHHRVPARCASAADQGARTTLDIGRTIS